MAQEVHYCMSWFAEERICNGYISEKEAENLHDKGKLYTAVIGPIDKPTHYVEIRSVYIGVGFLDDNGKEWLSYQFKPSETRGDFFLSTATFRTFSQKGQRILSATTYYFKENGVVHVAETDFLKKEVSEYDTEYHVNSNYEPPPQFGHLEGYIREER